jgi:hypothetical protein
VAFNEEMVQMVWEKKARVDPQADPATWRKDQCGAWMKRGHYANRESEFGWEIDYITPGGRDDLSNLRAVHWQNYVAGGIGHVVCKVTADPGGIKNKAGK